MTLRDTRVLQNTSLVFISAVATGIPSVIVLYVADLVLSRAQLSEFIKTWALFGTLTVGVTSPLISFSPHLRREFGDSASEFDLYFFPTAVGACLVLIVPAELVILYLVVNIRNLTILAAVAFLTICSISFHVRNAHWISKGSFDRFCITSVLYGSISTFLLCIILKFNIQSPVVILFTFGVAFGIASSIGRLSKLDELSYRRFSLFLKLLRNLKSFSSFGALVVVTVISTFIINGPLLLGTSMHARDDELITFNAHCNICLVAFTILNSFSAPIQNALISSKRSNPSDFKRLYQRLFTHFSILNLFALAFTTLTLNFFSSLYVSSALQTDILTRFLISSGFAFSSIATMPRIRMMFLNRYLSLVVFWFVGLVSFFLVLLLPGNALLLMALSQSVASGVILLLSHIACRLEKW